MAENSKEPCWYVVHTYSGYENKVKDNIEKSVENNPEMQRLIFDVRVPVEDVVEIKGNKRVKSQRKVYPGYVLVHMIETSESWYLVRNTRGVTGFVGPDSKPVALTPAEVDMMLSTQQNSVSYDRCPKPWERHASMYSTPPTTSRNVKPQHRRNLHVSSKHGQ